MSAESDPLLGQLVGSYKVLKRLGVGGMGAVYEGVEANIDKRAALKIVHPHLSADPRLPSLLAEAKAVNAIGDEGIVDIYGFGTLPDGRSYLVMELLEGEPLDVKLAREKKLGAVETIDLLLPLLHALEAAHAAGFVHRDLKAANVFIVRRGNRAPFPKLLDFGVAKQIKLPAKEALGTADYIAPEQAANRDVGAKADLYALGCLTFELLSGQLPFRDASAQEVVRQHREAPRPSVKSLVPEVPDALDALVKQLMSVDPEGRPTSAATVRATLLQLREQLTPKPRKRWPTFAGLAAVAVVSAVLWLALRPQVEVALPLPPPKEDPVAVATARAVADVEAELKRSPAAAVDLLLAAEASFAGRPEWLALEGRVGGALRLEAKAALQRADAEGATKLLGTLGKLAPLKKDDPLLLQVERLSFALHSGMVQVGEVFIDRYEYPNRAGAVPATKVDWADAVKLCEGAGKHLCSEQEWESACRGEAGLAYPWGAKLEKGRCVTKGKVKKPAASGAHPKCVGAAGVFDLTGNVAEWTSSPVREGAPQKVTRGGSFVQSDGKLACDARDYSLPGLGGAAHLGLRCCL